MQIEISHWKCWQNSGLRIVIHADKFSCFQKTWLFANCCKTALSSNNPWCHPHFPEEDVEREREYEKGVLTLKREHGRH